MTQVILREGESFNSLYKRFRKAMQRERIFSQIRRQRFYEKPSESRQRKAAKKLRKSRKTTRKDQESPWR